MNISGLSAASLAAMFFAFVVVGTMDATDAQAEHEDYCGMVELYKQSGGNQGWPAYDDEVDCAKQ